MYTYTKIYGTDPTNLDFFDSPGTCRIGTIYLYKERWYCSHTKCMTKDGNDLTGFGQPEKLFSVGTVPSRRVPTFGRRSTGGCPYCGAHRFGSAKKWYRSDRKSFFRFDIFGRNGTIFSPYILLECGTTVVPIRHLRTFLGPNFWSERYHLSPYMCDECGTIKLNAYAAVDNGGGQTCACVYVKRIALDTSMEYG